MRTITIFALACLTASQAAFAQVYTSPAGYTTTVITPNASGSTAGSSTFISPSLVQSANFVGAATVSPSGGSVITFSSGVPLGLNSTSMLEITNGTQEGWWSAISSSTSTTITISDVFPIGLAANVSVTVRKFNTVQSVFGNNSPGLAVYSAVNPYDEIQFLNPLTQQVGVIVYFGGWLNLVTEADASGEIIYPGTAVKVIHRANTTLSVVSSGEVKVTDTQVDIYPNANWIGQPNPTVQTFGSMNLASQILGTDSINVIRSDTGTGQVTDLFVSYQAQIYNGVTEALAETEPVSIGNGYLLKRPTGAASTVTIPAQVVGQ